MAYINREYSNDGFNMMNYYGGNCGCSNCLNKGGNKMLPNPNNEYGLPDNREATIQPFCDCSVCNEATQHIQKITTGGNIFDFLANKMPDALGYVPVLGSILKPATNIVLNELDKYRKNPQNPENQHPANAYTYVYQKPKSSYNTEQQAILNKMKGHGKVKKGSADAKARMAYLRSLKKH